MTYETRRSFGRFCAVLTAVVAISSYAATALADDTWSEPFPGVWHLHRVTSEQNINVLEIELCHRGISFRATKFEERGQLTSAFGASVGAQAAINGDFFVKGFGLDRGFAVGDGEVWPASASNNPDDASTGQLAIGEDRIELIPARVIAQPEDWMTEVVGGRPTVVDEGVIPDTSGYGSLCNRNPRTVVGLTEDKGILIVAVVDGRAPTRVGMTCTELGGLMLDLSAHDALNLDGGGSSTMWFEDEGVLNFPTDGHERVVGNHLAIMATGEGDAAACSFHRRRHHRW